MQPYQEEYIANLKDITVLASRRQTSNHSLAEYQEKLLHDRSLLEKKSTAISSCCATGSFHCLTGSLKHLPQSWLSWRNLQVHF